MKFILFALLCWALHPNLLAQERREIGPDQIRQEYKNSQALPNSFAFRLYVESIVGFGERKGTAVAVHSVLDMLIGGHGAHSEEDFDRASTLYDQLVIAKYNIDSAISAQEAAIICPPSRSARTAAQHAQAMDQFDDAQEVLMADEFARFMSGLDQETRLALRAKLNDLKHSTTYVKLDHGKAYAAQGIDITATVDGWCRGIGK